VIFEGLAERKVDALCFGERDLCLPGQAYKKKGSKFIIKEVSNEII
jgi:hypothetical protein